MWQALYDDFKDRNFMVVAVAMDSRPDAARPFIEDAAPTYVSLIDRDHHLADLYNMVNVPQGVWIDEAGLIVRPPESAGAYEGFRAMDRATGAMPEAAVNTTAAAKETYVAALRDWAANGSASRFAFDDATARAHLALPSEDIAQAHANFRLGQHVLRKGRAAEAESLFAEAVRLHPDSWNIWRQTATVNATGLAVGPEFWARVDALGQRRYYAPVDIEGMPQ